MLADLSPIAALGLGILVGAIALLPIVWLLRRRAAEAEEDRERTEAVAIKAREILSAAPDGLFLWDRVAGGITCSRRLASLLSLSEGTNARFEDIKERFSDGASAKLDAAAAALHEDGTAFELVLAVKGTSGPQLIQAVGARAQDRKGAILADMIWMRDISTAARLLLDLTGDGDLPEARHLHLRALLDALPFPVWLRDTELKVSFTNQTALSKRVAGPDLQQAKQALGDGLPITRVQELVDAGDVKTYTVTECPLGADSLDSLIGYAFDAPEEDDVAPLPEAAPGAAPGASPEGAPNAAPQPELQAEGPAPHSAEFALAAALRANEQKVSENLPVPATEVLPAEIPTQGGASKAAEIVLAELTTAVAIFGADTRMTFCNRAYRELWRLDQSWLDERPDYGDILEFLRAERRLPEVPDFRAYKMEQLQQFDEGGEPTGDLMHLPDGRTLRAVSYPVDAGGLAFGYDDVTDQLDLERSINSLDAVQKATLDNLHEAIAVFGSDGRLKFSNPAFVALWNLSAETAAAGTHLVDFVEATRPLAVSADGWDDQKRRMLASMMSREISRGRLHRSDERVVEYANVPLPDGAVLISYLDVTDDAKLERALTERAEALKEANRLKSDFIAHLSQELRMPLTSITGFAEMLAGEYFGELRPRQKEYAQAVVDTSRNLMEVVSNTLELAAIEAEQVELELSSVDVHGMLAEVLKLGEERARRKQLAITFNVAPDMGQITADERRLKQAVFNLLSNAITFTPARGKIALAGERNGNWIEVTVSDTGPGIRLQDEERLFQAFEQTPAPDGEHTGPGLGLALVRSFIELHGGHVSISSKPGHGTSVTCKLPADNP